MGQTLMKPLYEALTPEELVEALLVSNTEVDFVDRKALIATLGPDIASRFLPALPRVVGVNTTDLLMTIKVVKPELIPPEQTQ